MLAVVIVMCVPTLSWRASLQMLFQVGCLAGWVWSFTRVAKREKVFFWFFVALILPVAIGLWQSFQQFVPASTVFGLAEQDPTRLGVSVIQIGAERFLRAYGSFPHPNIFGGWIMFVLLMLWWRSWTHRALLWFLPFFSLGLYLTFSRSAWVALGIGAFLLLMYASKCSVIRLWLRGAALIGLTFALAIGIRPDLLFTRLQTTTRLEAKSINERVASLKQGIAVIGLRPFGTGMGAYRIGLANLCAKEVCDVPAEPPHMVPLLFLAELGIFRTLITCLAAIALFLRNRSKGFRCLAVVFPLLIVAAFDHYLWSLWAGQVLFATAIMLFCTRHNEASGQDILV